MRRGQSARTALLSVMDMSLLFWCLSECLFQCLFEIDKDVFYVLYSNAHADESVGNTISFPRFARYTEMGHGGGMTEQCIAGAQRDGARTHPEFIHEVDTSLKTLLQFEAHHCAGMLHLFQRDPVIRM